MWLHLHHPHAPSSNTCQKHVNTGMTVSSASCRLKCIQMYLHYLCAPALSTCLTTDVPWRPMGGWENGAQARKAIFSPKARFKCIPRSKSRTLEIPYTLNTVHRRKTRLLLYYYRNDVLSVWRSPFERLISLWKTVFKGVFRVGRRASGLDLPQDLP